MQEGAPSLTGEVFTAVQGRARLHGMDSVSGLHVLGSDTCALAFRVANGICCVSAGTCFQLRVQTNGASPCAEVSAFRSNTFICFCNGEVNPNALCFGRRPAGRTRSGRRRAQRHSVCSEELLRH